MTTLFCLLLSALIFLTAPWLMQILFHRTKRNYPDWGRISPGGRQFLLSHRLLVSMVWLLPGDMQASPIHHTHDTFSRDTRSLSLFLASIPSIGVHGIWWSIPIGWALADIYGQVYYWKRNNHYLLLPSFHNKKHKLCPYFT